MTKNPHVIYRISALSLMLMLLFTLLCTSVFAATPEEIKEQNLKNQIEKYAVLGVIENENIAFEVGKKVNSLLVPHKIKLNMISDAELALEATAITINLIYEQGIALNDLAWIYYSHVDSLDAEDAKAVTDTFNLLHEEILNATDPTALKQKNTAHFDNSGLCARMHVSIYSEKLDDLLIEGDSDKVIAKVEAAKVEITKCTDTSLTSPEYEAILAKAKFEVELQRAQDRASAELEEIFTALYGKDALKDNKDYNKALADVDDNACDTIEKINAVLLGATEKALTELASDGKNYEKAYYESLKAGADAIVERSANDEVADISSLLKDYDIELYRAQAKDDLADYIATKKHKDDLRMQELEDEYCAADGIFDRSEDRAAVDHELNKAEARTDLYDQYVDTVDAIKEHMGDSADTSTADSIYTDGDDLLNAATTENLDSRYNDTMAKLEIEEFKAIYDGTTSIPTDKITPADKETINEAIEALLGLNEQAKQDANIILAAQKLTELSKEITKQQVAEVLGGGGLRDEFCEKLNDQIDALTPEQLGDLSELCDAIAGKAQRIDQILDNYDEILAKDYYDSFNADEKNNLKATATDACEEILAGEGDADKIIASVTTELDRKATEARIEAKIREIDESKLGAVIDNVNKIKADAKANIAKNTDPEVLDAIAEKAIFDIQKEFDVQTATDAAEK